MAGSIIIAGIVIGVAIASLSGPLSQIAHELKQISMKL